MTARSRHCSKNEPYVPEAVLNGRRQSNKPTHSISMPSRSHSCHHVPASNTSGQPCAECASLNQSQVIMNMCLHVDQPVPMLLNWRYYNFDQLASAMDWKNDERNDLKLKVCNRVLSFKRSCLNLLVMFRTSILHASTREQLCTCPTMSTSRPSLRVEMLRVQTDLYVSPSRTIVAHPKFAIGWCALQLDCIVSRASHRSITT